MKYSLINTRISAVIDFILSLNTAEGKSEKQLNVEIDINSKSNNINICATGDWVRNFCIQKFKNDVWRTPKAIDIHMGDGENRLYQVCKINNVNISELEEQLLNDDDYLSMFFNVQKKYIQDNINAIRDFLKEASKRHENVHFKLVWKVNNLINEIIHFSKGHIERVKIM